MADVNTGGLAEGYLSALGRADLDALLALFSAGAVVHSPLYGPMAAGDFYAALLADTAGSQLTLRGVMDGAAVDGTPLVSVWFTVGWRLAGGTQVSFDVVDVLELAGDGRIAAPAYHRRHRWRPARLRGANGPAFLAFRLAR